jgi:hypothetical protein
MFELKQLGLSLNRITAEAQNAVEPSAKALVEKAIRDVVDTSQKVSEAVDTWEKKSRDAAQAGATRGTLTQPFAHIAAWSTLLAFLLLCIFGVKAVLAL